jgi:hypothetical protein
MVLVSRLHFTKSPTSYYCNMYFTMSTASFRKDDAMYFEGQHGREGARRVRRAITDFGYGTTSSPW